MPLGRFERGSDPRVDLILNGLHIEAELPLPNGVLMTRQSLAENLVWNEQFNVATLPTQGPVKRREQPFHILAVHSTLHSAEQDGEEMAPTLNFGQRPKEYRTLKSNVYGTGFYTANRPEAAVRSCNEPARSLGAFLTHEIYPGEILDARRRLPQELFHLGRMTVREMILPRIFKNTERLAQRVADRADERLRAAAFRVVLRNEAPRYRSEKLDHEYKWGYDLVPPQYMQVRTPMIRIGTYRSPEEQPHKLDVTSLYTKGFWLAAARNARDAKRQGVPLVGAC